MRSSAAIGLSDTLNDGTITGDELTTEPEATESNAPERSGIMDMSRQCLSDSTTYLDTNWRRQWEVNHDLVQSRHPTGSRYHSEAYKHRSRLFLPKIQAVMRRWESAVSSALFSTNDIISCRS